VLVISAADGHYKARLCVLGTWPDFTGYGFNLHAERAKPAQYIGKVDAQSPAEAAGLREGDRIVAVNGVDVAGQAHQDVVQRIRCDTSKVELLVVDPATDVYFRERGVVVSASMDESAVWRIVCPSTNIYTVGSASSQPVVTFDGAPALFRFVVDLIIRVVVVILGPLSDEAHSFIAEIGRRATLCTADPRETTFLYQRISVAIQRFNAACLANTFTVSESPS